MKAFRLFVAIIFVIFMASPSIAADGGYAMSSKAGPAPGRFISMDFQDANLKTILKIFSQQSGLNFVASENIKDRTVTIYFDNVTVEDALNHIMNANNLVYEQKPGSSIFIVRESGKPAVGTITKIYELKYAQMISPSAGSNGNGGKEGDKGGDILTVIQGIISENGKVIADKRSNSLIIKDVPSQFVIIEDVLSRLDTRTPQVMIEAEIIETSTTVADKLGINWSGTFGAYTGPIANTVAPLGGRFNKNSSTGEGIGTTGTVSFSGMTATISALLSNTDSRLLARPKILTLNNETASIELTSETAVASITTTTDTGSTATTSDQAERIDTGITLNVTPQINKDGYITMYIEPTVIVPVLSLYFQSGTQKYVDPQTRGAKTTVMVKDGETVVIGGLISRQDSYVYNKVPFLGDLPLLGEAFRYKTKDETDKELLIFITPHIVKEASYVLGNISEREQEKHRAIREEKINKLLDLLGG